MPLPAPDVPTALGALLELADDPAAGAMDALSSTNESAPVPGRTQPTYVTLATSLRCADGADDGPGSGRGAAGACAPGVLPGAGAEGC